MDLKVFFQRFWLRNPLRLILAWVLFMLHTNIPSAQTVHRRIYALNPSQDTFLQGHARSYYQNDFLEVGVRENGLSTGQESRTLIKFDIEKFKTDSHWGREHNFNHLNKTSLVSATLTLYCSSVYDSGNVGVDVYSDKIHLARVLKSWEEDKVTETDRNAVGDKWDKKNLATDGRDATEPLQNLVVVVDKQTCSAGESFTFNVTGIFNDWLKGRVENHGILLWAENTEDTRMVLRLASVDSGIVERHPVIEVQLEDTIYGSHECPSGELQCVDGNCVPQSKICNFVNDCLHGTDEQHCGKNCDFESVCDWIAPKTSDGLQGWEINRGNTSTPDTGPSGGFKDFGIDVSGQYIYVEASGKPNKTSAYFVSPMYAESGPECRLHFQYHMYGEDIGRLALLLKYQGLERIIWEQSGDQGDRWLGDVIHLGRLQDQFQLMFQAVLGNGELSDIALDDIQLWDCSSDIPNPVCRASQFQCTNQACISPDLVCDLREDCLLGNDEDASMCGVIPVGGACSFEDGWCEWFDIVGEDHFNWTRHQGATPTKKTGPSVDHTLGTAKGYYMFIEASGQEFGDAAHLRSRWFDPPPPEHYDKTSMYYQTCKVRFAYHMYGRVGTLKLYLIQNVTESASQLFSESSENHVEWITDSIALPNVQHSYYLQFESTRGTSYKGDIAIDDVSLSPQCFFIPEPVITTTENEATSLSVDTTQSETTHVPKTVRTTKNGAPLIETTQSMTTDYTTEEPIIYPVGNGTEFHFSSCGAYGSAGPKQQQCDYSYRYEDLIVTVLEGNMAGIQVWVVPETGPYSIVAKGASGGAGVENPGPSHGAVVEATFNLSRGDYLYILVGQQGDRACDSDGLHIDDVCRGQLEDDIREEYGAGGRYAGGGGGGGGATYIAKVGLGDDMCEEYGAGGRYAGGGGGGGGATYIAKVGLGDDICEKYGAGGRYAGGGGGGGGATYIAKVGLGDDIREEYGAGGRYAGGGGGGGGATYIAKVGLGDDICEEYGAGGRYAGGGGGGGGATYIAKVGLGDDIREGYGAGGRYAGGGGGGGSATYIAKVGLGDDMCEEYGAGGRYAGGGGGGGGATYIAKVGLEDDIRGEYGAGGRYAGGGGGGGGATYIAKVGLGDDIREEYGAGGRYAGGGVGGGGATYIAKVGLGDDIREEYGAGGRYAGGGGGGGGATYIAKVGLGDDICEEYGAGGRYAGGGGGGGGATCIAKVGLGDDICEEYGAGGRYAGGGGGGGGATYIAKVGVGDDICEEYGAGGRYAGGGGGGGGATYIAKEDPLVGILTPLLVAGGGGGLSFGRVNPENQSMSDGQINESGPGYHGIHADGFDVSGAGGGYFVSSELLATGKSFLQGGKGGQGCYKATSEILWNTRGGFGGGGGACTTGGGGGGYSGGNAPLTKKLEGNGGGGTSYIHKSGLYVLREAGGHSGPGRVDIVASVFCPNGHRLSDDKQYCLPPENLGVVKLPVAAIIGGVVPAFIIIILIIAILLLVYFRKSKQLKDAEQRMNTADFRLTELRHNANVDFNPCYSLGEGSIKVGDLKEVPRDDLTLTSALGQGAFGEVYHGLFKHPEEKEETQVAVKTLQETATEADEQDFLMEALIMGNFSHPNIVSLIGVCFTQHPRFILLEFMAGGELKVFLRERRPQDGEPSPLQMSDLLQVALDVSRGCEYLEARHFIHRDIAARNVLLSCKEKGRVAKIGDFGMARDIYRSDYYKKGGQALLPVKWMPPEAFMDGIFTVKTDIWAFGVLLWEIMSLGFMPYPGMSNHEVIQFVTKGERMNPPRYCPSPVQNMMTRCWRQVPDDRPTFSELRSNLMQCLQDPDIMRTPLPLKMTEMDHGRRSIIRPHNPETATVLRVESPSRATRIPAQYQDNTIFPSSKQPTSPIDVGDNTWVGRNGIAMESLAADHCDINANKKIDAKPHGLKVKIPPVSESASPRRQSGTITPRRDSSSSTPRRDSSTPKTPGQFANPSYAYNSPTPDTNLPNNPFSSTINDHDSASEKSDLISRDEDDEIDSITRNELTRSSKQKSGTMKSGLKALLRQTSRDTESSGSLSNTPSPSPTSLTFSRQGSGSDKSSLGKDDHSKSNGLTVANGKVAKDKGLSPSRVLRFNSSNGSILFEEEDNGEIV